MSVLAEEIAAFQDGICCVELVSQAVCQLVRYLVCHLVSKSVT